MILDKSIPLKHELRALIQWASVSFVLLITYLAGFFMAFFACLTSKRMKNAFGEQAQEHEEKYLELGSSGYWEYWASPLPFVRLWSNYEDGDLGEPSGKQSVRCNGKERAFWNRYKWNAFRNPFNMGKRTIQFFHCLVNDCDIEYWGDEKVSDKHPDLFGWQFVKATHKKTKKSYYGYYSVKDLEREKIRVLRFGFKVKPSHIGVIQDADDKDKAFTFRCQLSAEIG